MEKHQAQLLQLLSDYFTLATKNVSSISRTWSLAIVFPACTWLLKEDSDNSIILIIIVGIALLSLLIDCAQNIFVSLITKRLLDRVESDITKADSKFVNSIMKPVHTKTFAMVIIKSVLMVIDSVLLVIYTLLML